MFTNMTNNNRGKRGEWARWDPEIHLFNVGFVFDIRSRLRLCASRRNMWRLAGEKFTRSEDTLSTSESQSECVMTQRRCRTFEDTSWSNVWSCLLQKQDARNKICRYDCVSAAVIGVCPIKTETFSSLSLMKSVMRLKLARMGLSFKCPKWQIKCIQRK